MRLGKYKDGQFLRNIKLTEETKETLYSKNGETIRVHLIYMNLSNEKKNNHHKCQLVQAPEQKKQQHIIQHAVFAALYN